MSTDYKIIDDLYALEHSSVVDLYCGPHLVSKDLSSKQLVAAGLALIKVASYIDGDLVEAIKDQEEWTIHELKRVL